MEKKITKHDLIKVAIIGPESTGKTTLVQQLAEHFQTVFVPEFAREYLNDLNGTYEYHDLLSIAEGQLNLEGEMEPKANKVLFCDTELTVIQIWSLYKYGICDDWILQKLNENVYDLYLLTDIDIPWTPDTLREHPNKRNEILDIYKKNLRTRGQSFILISGNFEKRLSQAVASVNALLQ